MPMTLIKSGYQTQLKPGTQNNETQGRKKSPSLPSNLRTFQRNFLSKNGLIEYGGFLKT